MDYSFNLPAGFANSDAFRHRPIIAWAADLLDLAGISRANLALSSNASYLAAHGANEQQLRFLCVLLNQHADQAPWDTTPSDEAIRLEDFLARQAALENGDDVSVADALQALRDCLDVAVGDTENVPTPVFNAAQRLLSHLQEFGTDGDLTIAEVTAP